MSQKEEPLKVEISQASVQSIIKAHVQTAVMEALLPHKEQFVREIVEKSLLQPAKSEDYRYKKDHEKPTELEHMVRKIIAEEARKGIQEWAESHRAEIAEKIRQQMATRKFGRAVAAQIAEQLATAPSYSLSVIVKAGNNRD